MTVESNKRGGYILQATKNKQLLIILNSAQVVKVTTLRNTEEETKRRLCLRRVRSFASFPAERGEVEDSRYAPGHVCNMLCILADRRVATLLRFV